MPERAKLHTVSYIYVFKDPDGTIARLARKGTPTEVLLQQFKDKLISSRKVEGNVFLAEGINFIWKCVVNGNCSPPFDNANAHIGVGDGTDPEDPSQTGLTGTNKYYKGMDEGYPIISGTKVIFRATFGPDEANFSWNEWTVANGPGDDYINLNRKQENLGTKVSGTTWVLQVELSIS